MLFERVVLINEIVFEWIFMLFLTEHLRMRDCPQKKLGIMYLAFLYYFVAEVIQSTSGFISKRAFL